MKKAEAELARNQAVNQVIEDAKKAKKQASQRQQQRNNQAKQPAKKVLPQMGAKDTGITAMGMVVLGMMGVTTLAG